MSKVAASGRLGVTGSWSTGGGPTTLSCDVDDDDEGCVDDVGPFDADGAIAEADSGSMQ